MTFVSKIHRLLYCSILAATVCIALLTQVSWFSKKHFEKPLEKAMFLKPLTTDLSCNRTNAILFTSKNPSVQVLFKHELKKFVYLIQTESCLSDYHKSPQVIGSSTSCQCDILVLSWKEKCNDTSLPHVEYIFHSKTTWTTGRNLLFRTVMNREQRYLYYTFMDDDVTLTYFKKENASRNAWRDYENSLLRVQPLVGLAYVTAPRYFPKYFRDGCGYSNDIELLPYPWFDGMFNSFHHQVIHYLLPYFEKMDKTSWWYSQVYLVIKTDLFFPGQVLHQVRIQGRNHLHRVYPKKMFTSKRVASFSNVLREEIPRECQEIMKPLIQDWITNLARKEKTYYRHTCPPLPHSPFIYTA